MQAQLMSLHPRAGQAAQLYAIMVAYASALAHQHLLVNIPATSRLGCLFLFELTLLPTHLQLPLTQQLIGL